MSRRAPVGGTLSDGRAVYFYGDDGRPTRIADDRRRLPPFEASSQLRRDPLTEEWVVFAPHRMRRPQVDAHVCALCPTTPTAETEIPAPEYDVAVFENRFPALAGLAAPDPHAPGGIHAEMPAVGRCEVISFSSDHNASLAQLPVRRVRTVIDAWADRTQSLNGVQGVEQVVCFENRGGDIGATVAHPHGQIYAYPFVPSRLLRLQEAALREERAGRACLFCRILAAEEKDGRRLVLSTATWSAFVPFAARWPFEVHLYARRHVPDLTALHDTERADLAFAYKAVLQQFEWVMGGPLPYMAVWVQASARQGRDLAHLHVQIFSDRFASGRRKRLAAGELGAGAHVSEELPERAAELLRAAAQREPRS